jgi:DNA repair protein RadD
MIRQLRPHQVAGIEALREALRAGKRRPVLQAATGAGKTLLAAGIIEMALNKKKRALFTVPRISLIDQTVDAFMHEGVVDVGVIQACHEMTDPTRLVQVASVQTLMRREVPKTDLVIVDECHLAFEWVHDWMAQEAWKRVPFIGLSATPWTKGLGKHWDHLIVAATTKDLIEKGLLSPYRCFAPSHPDLTGVKTQAGDYAVGQLSKAMSKPKLVADVVQTWLEKAEDRPTLCFCVDRAHAKHVQQKFQAAGVACGYVDAYSKPEERKTLERDFRDGTLRVACSVGVLTTGIDWDVRCISLARPTKSEMLYVQMIGRGLRTAPGKQDCLVLDHSDTTLRLGFPADIHHEHLDDGKERAKPDGPSEGLPKKCPECSYLKPPKTARCPSCGFETKHGPRAQEIQDGRLVELTPGKPLSLDDKYRLFGQLKAYARSKGYAPGWASHKYREFTGRWPDAVKSAAEVEPTQSVLNWIKSQQRAFRKARAPLPSSPPLPQHSASDRALDRAFSDALREEVS